MGRIITVVVTLFALGWLVSRALGHDNTPNEASKPKQQLDNVHHAATRIEAADQKYVDDAMKKTEGP